MKFLVWRIIDQKLGCVDFVGEIEAPNLTTAEAQAENDFTLDKGESFDIEEA